MSQSASLHFSLAFVARAARYRAQWGFDPRGAETYLTVRRASRSKKTPLGAVHRRPQQKAGEKCRLELRVPPMWHP